MQITNTLVSFTRVQGSRQYKGIDLGYYTVLLGSVHWIQQQLQRISVPYIKGEPEVSKPDSK